MKRRISTKDICIVGMGIALFVTLSMCLRVPIFENYYICLGYVVMTLYLYAVGTVSGTLVGCIGTLLYCILINGLRGMPGWIVGNLIIGVVLGTVMKRTSNILVLSIVTCLTTAIGILGGKSLVECLLYSQPLVVRMATNMSAFIADAFTIVISLPLSAGLKKYIVPYFMH